MRLFLLLLLPLFALSAHAQGIAPVEQHTPAPPLLPNAPAPAPTQAQIHADKQWERLIRGTHYARQEVRIQATGDTVRCDVDKVTADEIFCTQHRANNGPLGSLFFPKAQYHVPRKEIRDVRVGGREFSTLIGGGIGAGLGVGLGSLDTSSRTAGAQVYGALFFGCIGAVIGHALPLAGHPVYRQP